MSEDPFYQIYVTSADGLHLVNPEIIGGIRGVLGWKETTHLPSQGKGSPDFEYRPKEPVEVPEIEKMIDSVISNFPLNRDVHDMNEEL